MLTPRSLFDRPDKGIRIPFKMNDVDCVVNTNVMKLLTATQQTSAPGYQDTCNYLNSIVDKKDYYSCGMYYPSQWVLPYSMATAMTGGVSCLRPSQSKILNFVLSQQSPNGYWLNHTMARPDYIQSTAWGLNTLLLLGDRRNPEHRERAARALRFLLAQGHTNSKGQLYWPGEVFYAATFVARLTVVWRADAYTTATVARALLIADRVWGL